MKKIVIFFIFSISFFSLELNAIELVETNDCDDGDSTTEDLILDDGSCNHIPIVADASSVLGDSTDIYEYQIFSKSKFNSNLVEYSGVSARQTSLSFLSGQIDNLINLVWANSYSSDSTSPIYVLKIVNISSGDVADKLRSSAFQLKNANGIKSENGFNKSFKLKTKDTDGLYVGYINKFLGTTSRGYYVKKYDDIEEINKKYYFVNYIEIGKANFKDSLASELSNYMKINETETVIPALLFSYSHYKESFGIAQKALEDTGYTEDESTDENTVLEAGFYKLYSANVPLTTDIKACTDNNENCNPQWSGYIEVEEPVAIADEDTSVGTLASILAEEVLVNTAESVRTIRENEDNFSYQAIRNSLTKLKYNSSDSDNLINARYHTADIYGQGDNSDMSLFLEDGDIFNYNSRLPFENLNVHMQMASTFMAINNIRRGFVFENKDDNFNIYVQSWTEHKKHFGVCYSERKGYIQHATWGGSELYSINYVDESYVDNWDQMEIFNNNIKLGPIIAPTIIPINVSSKLPALNKKNYLMTYSFNYLGDTYKSEYVLMNINPYIKHTGFHYQTATYYTSWGWTFGLVLLISVVLSVFTMGASLVAFSSVMTIAGAVGITSVGALAASTAAIGGILTLGLVDFGVDSQSSNTNSEILTEDIKSKIDTVLYTMSLLSKDGDLKDSNFKTEADKSSIFESLLATPETSDIDKIKFNSGFDAYAQANAIKSEELFSYKNDLNQNLFIRDEEVLTTMLRGDNCTKFWCVGDVVGNVVRDNRDILKNGGNSNLSKSPYDIKNTFKVIVHNYIGE